MRTMVIILCAALFASAQGQRTYTYTSVITFPDFLRYFPSYTQQYISSSRQQSSKEEPWGYESDNGPATWGRSFPSCSGLRQSPIALSGSNVESGNFKLDLVGYDKKVPATIMNNGHTVVVRFDYGNQSPPKVTLKNGDTSLSYVFGSLHFHWPGEHTIDDRRYDVEMHMVHSRDPSDTTAGDSMLVLGYVFQVCANCRPGMEQVADVLPFVREVNESAPIAGPTSPALFMPEMRAESDAACKFFLYPGSLTTPPCTESVTWLVKKTPLCITRSQLYRLRNLVQNSEHHTLRDNYRFVQPLNGRTVQYKSCSRK